MRTGGDRSQRILRCFKSGRREGAAGTLNQDATIVRASRRQKAEPIGLLSEAKPFDNGASRAFHSLTVTMQVVLPPG